MEWLRISRPCGDCRSWAHSETSSRPAANSPDSTPAPMSQRSFANSLSADFLRHWRPERFAHLVDNTPPLEIRSPHSIHNLPARKPTIAVAYDEAFFGYFPSTLDQLELLGAQVVDFSPLHDESLPPETDIVYLGCGRPEAFAQALSENHCMKSALHSHVAGGGRIYGEVGGAAYLSQMIETPSGEMKRMCGILPAVAKLRPDATCIRTDGDHRPPRKLAGAPRESPARLPSGRWQFKVLGCRMDARQKSCCHPDLVGCNCAVGSLIHFHFAAFPEMFQSFSDRRSRRPHLLDPWYSAS